MYHLKRFGYGAASFSLFPILFAVLEYIPYVGLACVGVAGLGFIYVLGMLCREMLGLEE